METRNEKKRGGNTEKFAKPKAKAPIFKKKRTRSESNLSKEKSSTGKKFKNAPALGSEKKKIRNAYDPKEEARLATLVFGEPNDVIENLMDDKSESLTEAQDKIKLQVVVSESSDDEDKEDDNESVVLMKSDDESITTVDSKIKGAAWKDEDDDELLEDALKMQNRTLPKNRPEKKYAELLTRKFINQTGTPKWAQLDREKKDEAEGSDDEILKHSNHLVSKISKPLPKGNIELKVLAHINKQTHTEGPFINTVQFHKTATVAYAAGSAGVLSLFEIDGRENNKLHSVQFSRFPIHTARFLKEDSEIIVGSMSHRHCFTFDMLTEKTQKFLLPHGVTNMKKFEVSPDGEVIAVCGRFGEVYLLSASTKESIGMVKMNKKCRDLCFTPDSKMLLTHGDSSDIYVWDVKSRVCINRAYDDGCLAGCSIAVSPSGQFIATGSKQGAVNVYEAKSILNEKTPTPVKTVLNLVTAITKLKFNSTSEILAMASDRKANALKMLHLSSLNVFANFPTFNTKMFNPLDIDFSPSSGYMGLSNNRGFAYLYRLKHYGNY